MHTFELNIYENDVIADFTTDPSQITQPKQINASTTITRFIIPKCCCMVLPRLSCTFRSPQHTETASDDNCMTTTRINSPYVTPVTARIHTDQDTINNKLLYVIFNTVLQFYPNEITFGFMTFSHIVVLLLARGKMSRRQSFL